MLPIVQKGEDFMMLFGLPVSWIIYELFAVGIFLVCVVHASRRPNAGTHILELIAFVIAAAIFENIGVAAGIYDYDLHRVMLVGKVPLHVLMLEASIVYAALILTEKLNLPDWAKPLAVGLFSSIQDMTIDPASVFDTYLFDGALSGQWNWVEHYDGMFFGIPFFNFTGWFSMTMIFAFVILLGRRWTQKHHKLTTWYPLLAVIATVLVMVSPINTMILYLYPVVPMYTKWAEVLMMALTHIGTIVILLVCHKRAQTIGKSERICLVLPVVLHVFDILIAFATGNTAAYLPCLLISALHIAYLFWCGRPKKASGAAVGREAEPA